jgi:tRNA pseudouridine38-40 synthase
LSGHIWKLTIEYDGTDFSGWQAQPGVRTVQVELERALAILLKRELRVAGAGRTDAGVHAAGQVASFPALDADPPLDDGLVGSKLNAILSPDVVVRRVDRMPPGFNARFTAIRRHYAYRLYRGKTAIERRTALSIRGSIDVDLLARAAARVPGTRDFASIGSPPEPGESTVCRLETLEVSTVGSLVILEVSANRFLRKMVRTLVGVLLEVARGRRPPEWVDEVLEARRRSAAGAPAAARGLTLVAVDYPDLGSFEREGAS